MSEQPGPPGKAPIRVAIVTNILSPYRVPLFEEIAQLTESVKVFLMAEEEENRHWELHKISFPCQLLHGVHWRPPGFESSLHLNYGVGKALAQYDPDIVLSGGFTLANVQAARYCVRHGKSYIGWGEVSLRDKSARSLIRKVIRRYLARRSVGTIASSTEAKNAFLTYGASVKDTLVSVLPIDVEHYHQRTQRAREGAGADALKQRFPGKVILSVGQLIARKGYKEMFAILKIVQQSAPDVSLVILGEGPLHEQLEKLVAKKGLNNVFFEGYVQADVVPEYLAIADVFVFHTLFDTFGAVLSEAMAAGCVSVASIHAAATVDLIVDGETGFAFDPTKTGPAAGVVIEALALEPATRDRMGESAYQAVAGHNYKAAAREMVDFMTARATPVVTKRRA